MGSEPLLEYVQAFDGRPSEVYRHTCRVSGVGGRRLRAEGEVMARLWRGRCSLAARPPPAATRPPPRLQKMTNKKNRQKKKSQQAKAPAPTSNGANPSERFVTTGLTSSPRAHTPCTRSESPASMPDLEDITMPPAEDSSTPPVPPPEEVDTAKQAEKVKEEGNAAFKAQKFQAAIESYTRAIGECLVHVLRVLGGLHRPLARQCGGWCVRPNVQRFIDRRCHLHLVRRRVEIYRDVPRVSSIVSSSIVS